MKSSGGKSGSNSNSSSADKAEPLLEKSNHDDNTKHLLNVIMR